MMSFARRATRNSLFYLLSQVWDMVVTLGTNIVLQRHYLSPADFGHYAVVTSLVTITVMLSFMGLQEVGVRELTSNPDTRNRSICFGNLLLTRVVLLVLAGVLMGSFLMMQDYPKPVVYGSILFYIALCVGSSAEMMMSAFIAAERFQFNLYVLFAERLTFLVGVILVWRFNLGFLSIFSVIILSKMVKALFSVHYLRTHFFDIVFKLDLRWIFKTLKESCLLGLGISLGMGLNYIINLTLEHGCNMEQVGYFYAFLTPIVRIQMLSTSISQGLVPRIDREAKADSPIYFMLVRRGMWVLSFLGCLALAIGYPLRGLIIGILCNKAALVYLPAFGYLLLVLPTLFMDNILNAAFISRRLARHFFFSKLLGFLVGAVVTYVLVWKFGLYGGVAGFVLGKWSSTVSMLIILHVKAKNWGHGSPALDVVPGRGMAPAPL